MSVNFGYGYGIGNGMNQMGMNSMMGQGGNIYQSVTSQYSCPLCYQQGPTPCSWKTYVNPIPKEAATPSFLSRIFKKFFGG
jgi:hypothetical protein